MESPLKNNPDQQAASVQLPWLEQQQSDREALAAETDQAPPQESADDGVKRCDECDWTFGCWNGNESCRKYPHLVAPAVAEQEPRIYVASKTKCADIWRSYRESGFRIISTWIDEAGPGETADYAELAQRCVREVQSATALVLYTDDDDILKGAIVEAGVALAHGIPVFCVGEGPSISRVFAQHPLWRNCPSKKEALDQATAWNRRPAAPVAVGETPETDAAEFTCVVHGLSGTGSRAMHVLSSFARNLERQRDAARRERDEAKSKLDAYIKSEAEHTDALAQKSAEALEGINALTAERDRLREELAMAKADASNYKGANISKAAEISQIRAALAAAREEFANFRANIRQALFSYWPNNLGNTDEEIVGAITRALTALATAQAEAAADKRRLDYMLSLSIQLNGLKYGNFYLPETREGIDAALDAASATEGGQT